MRCPWCGAPDTKVVDSRPAEEGAAIRRRRACRSCGRRFTTFERTHGAGVRVIKRDGTKEPYDREKVIAGVRKAIKNRPVTDEQVLALAGRVEELTDFEREVGLMLQKRQPKRPVRR
jgi:transcriptional repressor NrdR